MRKKGTASATTGSGRDYVAIAIAYARDAVADKKGKKQGRLFRLAAKRFLSDLARAKKRGAPFKFDAWHACDPCDFIEKLPHVEGKWDTPDIVLHPAHVFFVVNLFGFRKPDGARRFSSALLLVARKNAKSTLAAGIMLYCQCCENEEGAQLISAATTFDQSKKVWDPAKRMVEKTPDLRDAFGLRLFAKSIARMEIGASFKPINAKASTQDGLNPSHTALDEIHAHKTPDLLNVLTSAAGARKNPLWLYTTTEGYENAGPWSDLRRFAEQLLDGLFGLEADHFLAVPFCVDDDDKDFDEKSWRKANPLLDVNPHLLEAIRKEAVEAKAMPSKLSEFRIKRLNRRASVAKGWIDILKWRACNRKVDLEQLLTVPCWGGLDLNSTTDMAALRLVWRHEGWWLTWGRYWVPEDAVQQRTERGTVPYAAWVQSEHVVRTEGSVTDYRVIEAEILELRAKFNLQLIAFDQWNSQDLVNRLLEQQLPMAKFIQGTQSYHPAMQELERAYVSGVLAHGGDPVLNWNAANIVARRDVNMNMAPDRKKSSDKIDGMAALLMAIGAALSQPTAPKSFWE